MGALPFRLSLSLARSPIFRKEERGYRYISLVSPGNVQAAETNTATDVLFKSASLKQTIGPICVIDTKENGRGLGVTRALTAGSLLFVEEPIAAICEEDIDYKEEGSEADLLDLKFEALQSKLMTKKYTKNEIDWLSSLATMKEEAGKRSTTPSAYPSLELTADRVRDDELLPFPSSIDLEGLIQVNSFEAESEDKDLAYTSLKEQPKQEVMGIFPRYAVMNHSCTPNTVSFLHRGKLITVATRPIGKGSELTTNYIGELLLMAPLDARREALEDQYGFVCRCHRCRDEDSLDQNMKELVTNIYDSVTDQVREDFEKAIEEEDEEAISELSDQLQAFVEVLHAAFEKANYKSTTQTFLQASVFDLYELLSSTLEAKGEVDTRLLELMAALTKEIQPGSELQLYYSRLCLMDADGDKDLQQQSFDSTMAAYATRYGPISIILLKNIIRERERAELSEDQEE